MSEFSELSQRLTDLQFQNTLKEKFLGATYQISHPGERALVPLRIGEYLSRLITNDDREFAQTILERTVYISDPVLTDELTRITGEFLSVIGTRPYYVFLNRFKFASTELMIIKVMALLMRANLVGFITDESIIPDGSNVAIIDDASYSGNNLEAIVESISTLNKPRTVQCHVLIPYISQFMYEALPKLYNVKMYSSNLLFTVDEYQQSMGKEAFPDWLYQRFQAQEKIEFHSQIPLYFDHAVASADSSFPTIYLRGIVPDGMDYGKLIGHCPDQEVRHGVYSSFEGLLPNPMPLKQKCY